MNFVPDDTVSGAHLGKFLGQCLTVDKSLFNKEVLEKIHATSGILVLAICGFT